MCSQTYSNFDGDAEKCGTNKSTWDKIIGKQNAFQHYMLFKLNRVYSNFTSRSMVSLQSFAFVETLIDCN